MMPESATIQPAPPTLEPGTGLFIGSASAAMKTLESVATEIAATSIPVIIVGESGTGKQALARYIHQLSAGRSGTVWRVACGSVTPETLLAQMRVSDRKAAVGTVVFDEVCDLDRECQRRLLHALPDGDAAGTRDQLSARVISTATQNPEDEVCAGRFRNDLYHRLNGVSLRIPPLRERREDIPRLIDYFLAKHAARFARPRLAVSSEGLQRLAEHSWSGNVRELENVVMKMLALGDETIALSDLAGSAIVARISAPQYRGNSLKAAARAASREAERELILKALARTRWNRKRAAQELQISYKSLLYKLKQIGLPDPERE
jgi:two-component system, NtrC family, response regulator AtoC